MAGVRLFINAGEYRTSAIRLEVVKRTTSTVTQNVACVRIGTSAIFYGDFTATTLGSSSNFVFSAYRNVGPNYEVVDHGEVYWDGNQFITSSEFAGVAQSFCQFALTQHGAATAANVTSAQTTVTNAITAARNVVTANTDAEHATALSSRQGYYNLLAASIITRKNEIIADTGATEAAIITSVQQSRDATQNTVAGAQGVVTNAIVQDAISREAYMDASETTLIAAVHQSRDATQNTVAGAQGVVTNAIVQDRILREAYMDASDIAVNANTNAARDLITLSNTNARDSINTSIAGSQGVVTNAITQQTIDIEAAIDTASYDIRFNTNTARDSINTSVAGAQGVVTNAITQDAISREAYTDASEGVLLTAIGNVSGSGDNTAVLAAITSSTTTLQNDLADANAEPTPEFFYQYGTQT